MSLGKLGSLWPVLSATSFVPSTVPGCGRPQAWQELTCSQYTCVAHLSLLPVLVPQGLLRMLTTALHVGDATPV